MMKLIVCCLLFATPALAIFEFCEYGYRYPDTTAITNCQRGDYHCDFTVLDTIFVNITRLAALPTTALTYKITMTTYLLTYDLSSSDKNGCHNLAAPLACPIAAGQTIDERFYFVIPLLADSQSAEFEVSVRDDHGVLMCMRFIASIGVL